jgi:glutamyl-tRNA synthetase
MSAEDFAAAAKPYIVDVITNSDISVDAVAGILQARCEKLSDIPDKIGFFENLPDYDIELYEHKKSKTNKIIARDMLIAAKKTFEALDVWTSAAIHDSLIAQALTLEVKNATLMWPVRIAVTGRAVTPGGAVEICCILGRNETLRRIDIGIERLI